MILTGNCSKCDAEILFEPFSEDDAVCPVCGAVHTVEHDCVYDETTEDEWCYDYLLPKREPRS